jgi:Tfp pilus assembly PilM family ATPase
MPRRERNRGISHRVGLDIGGHTIKGVEIIERGSEIVIRSARSVATSPGETSKGPADAASVIQSIQTLWSSAEFETDKVVMALPPEAAYIKWLHLEKSSEGELDGIARAAAARDRAS